MDNKALAAAITTIENQLEILKASAGLSPEVGEEHHEDSDDADDKSDNKSSVAHHRAARRGRHKGMPKFEESAD